MPYTIYRVAQPFSLRGRGPAQPGRFVAVFTTGLTSSARMVIHLLASPTEKACLHYRRHGPGDPVRFLEESRLYLLGALAPIKPDELRKITPHLPKRYK